LPDLTGMTSDALDEIGLERTIDASTLRPTIPSSRVVGRAITVLNVPFEGTVQEALIGGRSLLADIEAHNISEPGDVLVVQGVDRISNMGAIMASFAQRQGQVGAIVDGGVRDVDHSRNIGYPMWCRSVSPITGKWRIRTIGINVEVTICGLPVRPGDLVVADEVGVCFVPAEAAADILIRCQRMAKQERVRLDRIGAGIPIAEILNSERDKMTEIQSGLKAEKRAVAGET
jgi:regulator of RNase E activity RraA